jgi:uncharacterized phage protein gp47/JayE
MVTIRSVNDIILGLIDFYKLSQPNLDTKPGTVARDLLIDAPANQLALLYDELSVISDLQSFSLVSGSDLDKLAKNFGLTRKTATPASGVALFTFNSLNAPIAINKGDTVLSSNGVSFTVRNGISIQPSLSNFYASIASKYKNDLDFLGIKDIYAVEVTVQASTFGTIGNISKYSLNRTNISGINNVTNINSFSGGNNQESDAVFRARVLSTFSGSNIGTSLGYKNVALSTDGVLDALVIEPGDPLMTRDGTVVTTNADGSNTIISEGTGGKVDIIILGKSLNENIDSFIYQDKSNQNDPTNKKNDFVLGQIAGDENKTINRKRIDNIANGSLPAQPVEQILEVTGSSSGSNFKEKSIDEFGRISGNYELVKDTSVYAGSPWGFDTFHWIDNKVTFEEDKIKGQFNGQDSLTYSDVLEIPRIQQNIPIINENSSVTSDRSIIQLLHTPSTNVTRVFNVNTGERYFITNQNVDGSGSINTTGRIKISGTTLPSSSDILQVDYNWITYYDQYADYDGRALTSNLRSVVDSVDWGYSSLVRSEKTKFVRNNSNTFFVANVAHPISSIISVKYGNLAEGTVSTITSGIFTGRLSITISQLTDYVNSIDSVVLKHTSIEAYSTAQNDGIFSVSTQVIGIDVLYTVTIILPHDTPVKAGDHVVVLFNSTDVYNVANSSGNFNNTEITIPVSNINTIANKLFLNVDYIASTQTLLSSNITNFPVSRVGNGFEFNKTVGFNNKYISNILRKENLVVQKNVSNQFYVELSLSSSESSLNTDQIVSIIRLNDNVELWNNDNVGTISTNVINNKFQLILNGFNSPAIGNNVLVIYIASDIRKFQPFTFSNEVIKSRFATLQYNSTNNSLITNIQNFVAQNGIFFKILEPNSDIELVSRSDGYLTPQTNSSSATFSCFGFNFSSIRGLENKKIRIYNSFIQDNNGLYDISSYDTLNNTFTISNKLNHISNKQISVIRLSDSQDLWDDSCVVSTATNSLTIPFRSQASSGDKVFQIYLNYNNLKQTTTKLSVNVSDQVLNSGVITVVGNTLMKAADIVFTATANGLKQNINEAMRKVLNLNSQTSLPSNVKLVKIAKLEKVSTVSSGNDEVLSVHNSYDINGTHLRDNSYFSRNFIEDTSLGNLEFILPPTFNNISDNTSFNNIPKIGDKLRITFYYVTIGDSENLSFTRNGTLYTNKSFGLIDKIFVASGFSNSISTKITTSAFNQPITGSRYKVTYNYTAPKINERITLRYNYNKLVSDVTFNIETSRPINADVIVKEAKSISVDLTMNIVITESKKTSSTLIKQNLQNALITALNQNVLGGVIDSSDLINTAYSIDGIDRARILFFNRSNSIGQVLSLKAQKNEYFVAGTITINEETR